MTDYALGSTAYFMFTSRQFSTGAPFVLAGSPVVSAYENADLTQITAGVSLGVSHDGVTGLNLITVVATSGNGFEAGKDYHLVVTAGTVDGVSIVGEVVGRFTIGQLATQTAAIADAVWDEDATAHQTVGAFGQCIGDSTAVGAGGNYSALYYLDLIYNQTDAYSVAVAVWDEADGIENGLTPRGALRLNTAALAGKVSGAGTATETFRNVGDSKNRIVATVDASGNRTAITTDVT